VSNSGLLGWSLIPGMGRDFLKLSVLGYFGAQPPFHATVATLYFTPSVMEVQRTEYEADNELQSGAKLRVRILLLKYTASKHLPSTRLTLYFALKSDIKLLNVRNCYQCALYFMSAAWPLRHV
jgi:hypothetical protein